MKEQAQDINKKLDDILEKMNTVIEQTEYLNDNEGKVTFTYRANDRMVAILPNLNTIMSKLEDLQNYRRELYKYDVPGEIYYNKKSKDIVELSTMNLDEPLGEGYTTYIEVQKVIDKLDNILDGMYVLLDKYWY